MIELLLTTEEAQLVRDACQEYYHETLKHTKTERGQRLAAQVHALGQQLADKVRLARD
jgi:hypothetical protein